MIKIDKIRPYIDRIICWIRPHLFRMAIYCVICAVGYLGIAAAVIYAYKDGLPSFDKLEDVDPAQTTNIFSRDGVELKKFWVQRRDPIAFEQLPRAVIDALIVTEDQRFWGHWGVSVPDIVRVVFRNVYTSGTLKGHGASTLTQQLARNIFLTLDPTWKRKIQEQMTAVLLERTYTKREIITMYFNQMYFGNSAYGIQTAARRFFGKDVERLTLDEGALLVGLLKGPMPYSPIYHPERSLDRRNNVVLYNMRGSGKITAAEYDSMAQRPIVLKEVREEAGEAPYFTEDIRKYLEYTYGLSVLYDGATVTTTLDSRLQEIAEDVVSQNLMARLKDRVAANWKRDPPGRHFLRGLRRIRIRWRIWCCRGRWWRWIRIRDIFWRWWAGAILKRVSLTALRRLCGSPGLLLSLLFIRLRLIRAIRPPGGCPIRLCRLRCSTGRIGSRRITTENFWGG